MLIEQSNVWTSSVSKLSSSNLNSTSSGKLVGSKEANKESVIDVRSGFTVGRSKDCDLRIRVSSVDNSQARITIDENGEYNLQHLGQMNQTLVNGVPIKTHIVLKTGDNVVFGNRKFQFVKPGEQKVEPVVRKRSAQSLSSSRLSMACIPSKAERESIAAAAANSPVRNPFDVVIQQYSAVKAPMPATAEDEIQDEEQSHHLSLPQEAEDMFPDLPVVLETEEEEEGGEDVREVEKREDVTIGTSEELREPPTDKEMIAEPANLSQSDGLSDAPVAEEEDVEVAIEAPLQHNEQSVTETATETVEAEALEWDLSLDCSPVRQSTGRPSRVSQQLQFLNLSDGDISLIAEESEKSLAEPEPAEQTEEVRESEEPSAALESLVAEQPEPTEREAAQDAEPLASISFSDAQYTEPAQCSALPSEVSFDAAAGMDTSYYPPITELSSWGQDDASGFCTVDDGQECWKVYYGTEEDEGVELEEEAAAEVSEARPADEASAVREEESAMEERHAATDNLQDPTGEALSDGAVEASLSVVEKTEVDVKAEEKAEVPDLAVSVAPSATSVPDTVAEAEEERVEAVREEAPAVSAEANEPTAEALPAVQFSTATVVAVEEQSPSGSEEREGEKTPQVALSNASAVEGEAGKDDAAAQSEEATAVANKVIVVSATEMPQVAVAKVEAVPVEEEAYPTPTGVSDSSSDWLFATTSYGLVVIGVAVVVGTTLVGLGMVRRR